MIGSRAPRPARRRRAPGAARLAGLVALAALAGAGGTRPAAAQESFHMGLVAHLPLSTCTDISTQGTLAFVGRSSSGVSIIDLADPAAPLLLTTWTHPSVSLVVNDPRPVGNSLFVSNESGDTFGLFELDITTSAAPVLLAAVAPPAFPALVHNIWPSGQHIYLSGYGEAGGNYVVDVSAPGTPVVEAIIPVGIHDNTVIGDTLYIAGGFDGTYLYDVSDKQAPVELAHFNPSTPDTAYYSHNVYPLGSSGLVCITEEVESTGGPFLPGSFRVVDFSDPANPTEVFRWYSENAKNDPRITIHNMYVIGDFAYLSHYQDGVRIFDVSDPAEPVEVAWYDTYPETPASLFEGCWGVDAFQGNDRIVASDRTHGVFVLSFDGTRKSTLTGTVRDAVSEAPLAGAGVQSLTANRSVLTSGAGEYTLRTGAGLHQIQVTAAGYEPHLETLVLEELATLTHDVRLVPLGGIAVADAGAPAAAALRLAPAAPNPLHPATRLRFTVPAAAAGEPLELEIFDVRGRPVRRLLAGPAPAGAQTRRWDGKDDRGERVASGLYLVRLQLGASTLTQKLVVAR